MTLRTLIRLIALSLGLFLASPFVESRASVALLLSGVALLALTFGYLMLSAGEGDLTRWQLRYQLDADTDLARLDETLSFLVERAGHIVVEASAGGLCLELPAAFDEYLQAQLPRALPAVRLARVEQPADGPHRGSSFFFIGIADSDLLRWATETDGCYVRTHIHPGDCATITAHARGGRPPGNWKRVPIPRPLRHVWREMPVWDELSAGTPLGSLFPPTEHGAAYSSQSRLLSLTPPSGYEPASAARLLGTSTNRRRITLGYDLPLFTVGAPHSFLIEQALNDLKHGYATIVVSPHRSLLERIAVQADGTTTFWLDPQDPWRSMHLSTVRAEDWADTDVDVTVDSITTFLADVGVDVHLPGINDFAERLIHVLVSAAQEGKRDLAFTDLYSIARNTQVLRTVLNNLQESDVHVGELLSHLDTDAGYVQAVTVLSAIHSALQPLGNGPLHTFCQAPFLDLHRALSESSLILVPMADADFPEHDRLLGAMLDLGLGRALSKDDNLRIALHLHEPDLYRNDGGRRWIEAAQRNLRLALLVDRKKVDDSWLESNHAGQAVFRCADGFAPRLITAWNLPASASDLDELSADIAIARLQGMIVALKVGDR